MFTTLLATMAAVSAAAAPSAPLPDFAQSSGRTGVTLYVSKLGNNTDGLSWANAFTTIQAALLAAPDGDGGHRVLVRPDTYMEANLYPSFRGAPGAYNLLEGDFEGRYGSGTNGWVVIDSGVPDVVVRTDPSGLGGNPGFIVSPGGPEKGLKSVDWWGPWRCDPTYSADIWDRWAFRFIYATGAEGGMGWDMTTSFGAEFSVVVEDCVGIGRAFGGIVGGYVSRSAEPVIYRRCNLWSLDWWGDAAAMYVRAEHKDMPHHPDAILEDCTLVGPQCSLKVGNPGYEGSTRVQLKGCRLVTLNFSQPQGTPTDGIIQSVIDGKYLHVDLEDCTLMGYKVFGVRKNPETVDAITYTTKGSVRAYVQYRQETPPGFHRLEAWPSDIFASIAPPLPTSQKPALSGRRLIRKDLCEIAPVIWEDRLYYMQCIRPATGGEAKDYYLILVDAESGEERARFAEGYSLACATTHDNTLYVFASRFENNNWNDVTVFRSKDLREWESSVAITQEPNEHLFNSSVCADAGGFVMAYESNDPAYPAFTVKFARSRDLVTWEKLPDAVFGKDRYTACPCIRYCDGTYYVLYTEHRTPRWFFETYLARSKDLVTWELSGANPILTPEGLDEGIDASDPDIIEKDGRTHLFFSVGDQLTWMNAKEVVYDGPLAEFFALLK